MEYSFIAYKRGRFNVTGISVLTDWWDKILRFRNWCSNPSVLVIITRLIIREICLFSQLTSQWTYFPVYGSEIIIAEF